MVKIEELFSKEAYGDGADKPKSFLDLIGRSSKDPVCSKKSHPLGDYCARTHWELGIPAWDDTQARKLKNEYPDPKLVYMKYEAPYKNHSVVELTQGALRDPEEHFTSEKTHQYTDRGPAKRKPFSGKPAQVHLGDDPPELQSQYQFTHRKGQEPKVMPPNTSKWPRTPANHIIHGAVRSDVDKRFWKPPLQNKLQQYSYIENDNSMVRDPIKGVYHPRPAHPTPTSQQYVYSENQKIPPLRSLGAMRHRLEGEQPGQFTKAGRGWGL